MRFKNYQGIVDAVRRIYREEGMCAFFRGLSVSYLGLTETAIQFTCYDMLKRGLYKRNEEPSKLTLFGTAALAKLIATTLTYPHEVVRTRMRERTEGKEYASIISSFKSVWKHNGFRGLYAGYEAHVCRTVPNAAIMFLIVEILLNNSL